MLHTYLAHDSPLLLSIFFVIFLVMQPYNFFSQYWERHCNIFEQITSQLLQSGIHYLEKYMRSNFLHLRIPLEILCFLMNYHKDQSIYLLSSLRGDKALPVHLDIEDATTDASHSCRRQEIWTLRWHKNTFTRPLCTYISTVFWDMRWSEQREYPQKCLLPAFQISIQKFNQAFKQI